MKKDTKAVYSGVFVTLLLFCGCLIRSKMVVDTTFLPRYLLVSVVLLIISLFGVFRKTDFRFGWYEIFLVLFYLWNLLSALWAISPSEALMQSQLVFFSLAIFFVISALCKEYGAFENMFIRIHLLVLLFSFGLAFYKMSTLEYFDPYKILSVSANNNLYAGFLIISLSLAFAGYAINKGLWKYLSAGVAVMAIFFIIIIQSRAGYLGLLVSLTMAGGLLMWRYRSVFSAKNLSVGLIALLLLVAGILLFYASLDRTRKNYFLSKIPVWQYIKPYENADVQKLLDQRSEPKALNTQRAEFDFTETYYENANLRMIFWKKSIILMSDNPWNGVGAGNWRIKVPSVKEPANPEHTRRNFTYSQPHNEWISILSELGIIGFLLAVFVFFLPPGIALWRMGGSGDPDRVGDPVRVVFYTSFLTGFYLFASFDFPLKRVEHTIITWAVLAFLIHHLKSNNVENQSQRNFFQSPFRLHAPKSIVVKSIFAFLLLCTVMLGMVRIKGEYFTLKMFMNEGKNDAGVIQNCRKAENGLYHITPNTLPIAWFEGVAWYRLGEQDTALQCFRKALLSTPYEVRVLNDEATALFSLKKTEEAKSVLLKTLIIDPFFDDARFNLGAIYYFTGKRDSALYHIRLCRNGPKKEEFLEEINRIPAYPQ